MIPSNLGSVAAEFLEKRDVIADGSTYGPMSQQHADDPHDHEMHSQKLVRLIGYHNPDAGKHEVPHRPDCVSAGVA